MSVRKNTILLCSPHGGHAGGIARWTEHILEHYEQLQNKNVDLSLFNLKRSTPVYPSTRTVNRVFLGVKDYSTKIRDFNLTLKNGDFDLVHITSSASMGLFRDLIMLAVARKYSVKTIVHFRFGRIPELLKKKNWEWKLLLKVIRLADTVLVIDQLSLKALRSEGFKHIDILANPIAKKTLNIIEENKEVLRINRNILFAGHVIQTKGVFELVRSCKNISDIKLKIVGAVSESIRAQLLQQAGDNPSAWLNITGELSYENTIKEMLQAAIFVLPTYTEGFPNVILESMAAGCPIIATNVGAIPEMLNIDNGHAQACGICLEPKNTEELTKKINSLLENDELSCNYSHNAQKRVLENYTMDIIWFRLTEIWEKNN